MPDLSRYERFLSIPIEDHEQRAKFGITGQDIDKLHDLAIRGEAPWPLYHQVTTAKRADTIYTRGGGREKGWTIAALRNLLSTVKRKSFAANGEEVQETISYQGWPDLLHVHRIRRSPCSDRA